MWSCIADCVPIVTVCCPLSSQYPRHPVYLVVHNVPTTQSSASRPSPSRTCLPSDPSVRISPYRQSSATHCPPRRPCRVVRLKVRLPPSVSGGPPQSSSPAVRDVARVPPSDRCFRVSRLLPFAQSCGACRPPRRQGLAVR